MKDVNTLCIACMNDKGNNAFCPHCGFREDSYTPPPHHLRPGTILNGKYWVGKALGEGGFGITYIGWDLNLELKTAIKEYFPNGFVSRDVSVTDTLTVFSGSDQNMFEQGREKFINEAKSLARFDSLPGIVSVKDFFLENGTAYIVMEYVDGETLKSFLKRNGGKASPETVFTMMEPLMKSLSKVHEQGIIHRDISPDNIMITKDSKVKLLDFGAARDISMGGQKSLSIQLKPGYAPEEQYRSHGKQGPWTDVYALCATMYMAITGVQPMESLERMHSDRVQPPSLLGIAINPSQEAALMHGMSVYAANRTPDVTQLYNELYGGGNYNYTRTPDPVSTYTDTNSSTRPLLLAVAVGGGIALAVLIIFAAVIITNWDSLKGSQPTTVPISAVTPTPTAAATATPIPAPVFSSVTASSVRQTDTEGGQYSVAAALSDDRMTKWAPSKSSGGGIGEWIQLDGYGIQYVRGIKVLNGYHKNQQTWLNNNRVAMCTITFSNGESFDVTLDDTMGMITVDFGRYVETASIRLTIKSLYPGAKWNDTAITYIGAY